MSDYQYTNGSGEAELPRRIADLEAELTREVSRLEEQRRALGEALAEAQAEIERLKDDLKNQPGYIRYGEQRYREGLELARHIVWNRGKQIGGAVDHHLTAADITDVIEANRRYVKRFWGKGNAHNPPESNVPVSDDNQSQDGVQKIDTDPEQDG